MKVGDKVLVVNSNQLYTTYSRFFKEEEIENSDWKIRYAFGNENIDTNVTYEILYINDDCSKALITEDIALTNSYRKYCPIYLINIKGLVLKDYEKKAESYFNRFNDVMSTIKAIRYKNSNSNEPRYKVEFSRAEAYSVEVNFGLMFSHIIRHEFGEVYLEYDDDDIYITFKDINGFVDFGKWFFEEY